MPKPSSLLVMKEALWIELFRRWFQGVFDFTPKIAEMIQFYEYVSTVLKPPIRFDWKGSIYIGERPYIHVPFKGGL